jgi:hypothetical protein
MLPKVSAQKISMPLKAAFKCIFINGLLSHRCFIDPQAVLRHNVMRLCRVPKDPGSDLAARPG